MKSKDTTKHWLYKGWYIRRNSDWCYEVYSCMDFSKEYLQKTFKELDGAIEFLDRRQNAKGI